MLTIIPNGTLKKGDPFPMIDVPTDVTGTDYTDFELEDYQWWAYSKSFNDWLKTSGRSWKASESEHSKEIEALVEKWKTEKIKDGNPVMSFAEFIKESLSFKYDKDLKSIFEEGEADGSNVSEGTGITQEQQIKFLFAYNKLLKQGAIQTTFDTNSDFNSGDEKAFFLTLHLKDDNEEALNLKGVKFISKSSETGGAGKLASAKEMYPGPYEIPQEASSNYLVTKFQQDLTSISIWAAGLISSWGIFTVAASVAAPFLFYRVLNAWQFSSAVSAIGKSGGSNAAKSIADLLRGGKAAKNARKGAGVFGRLGKIGTFVFKEGLGTVKGFKYASQAWKMSSKIKTAGRVLNAGKAFLRGVGASATRAIPVVGWVLLAVDAVGSMINWYSDNQAPTPDEALEAFDAKLTFSPTMVKVGESIVLCWSQPDNSAWGAALSFVVSNMGETRTVMEMVKIMDDVNGYSLFILLSANSESLNEQLKNNLLTLIAISNSSNLEQGIIDNPDFSGRICSVSRQDVDAEGNSIEVPFDFQGACNWETLVKAVEESEGVLFKADPNAPETYEFNFEDMDGDKINVVGTLVTDSDLANLTSDDIQRIFYGGIDVDSDGNAKIKDDEETGEPEETEETVSEKSKVVSFDSFSVGILNEENPAEGGGENIDSVLDAYTQPAMLAIYVCDKPQNKAYASKEIGKKKKLPLFTNFAINPDDYNAKPGDPIEVSTNSTEQIEDPRAGYVEQKEGETVERNPIDTEDPTKVEGGGEEGAEKVQAGGEKIQAPDIVRKERRNTTIIKDKDKDGGVNMMDEFVSDDDKEILGINNWDSITMVKVKYDKNNPDLPIKIILRNKNADFMDRSREYTKEDGESFDVAKKLVGSAQSNLEVKK